VTAPRHRHLALPTGLTYHCLEWGQAAAGDGLGPEAGRRTVVLVHGFLDLAWGWAEVATRLAERYHVIAPDLRGHGDSDWIGAGGYYHFFDYVADLDAVIARLAGPRLAVVGHSMGGTITAYWAGVRPTRADAVVLLEGLGPPESTAALPARAAGWIDGWAGTRRVGRPLPSVEAAAERLRRHDPQLGLDAALTLAGHGTRAVEGGVVWKHDPLHATFGPYPFAVEAAAQYWRAVAAPVLYVDGDASRLRLAEAELARRLACFPRARRQTLPGVGHMMMRHDPAAVAAAIVEHLDGVDAQD
jgi:pimeloyl-ACP methyl ester carboxylesterase